MPYARTTDPETSHEAAKSVQYLTATQQLIIDLLKEQPRADHELVAVIRSKHSAFPISGIRSRRSELVEVGLIKDSELRVQTPSGRSSIVWQFSYYQD